MRINKLIFVCFVALIALSARSQDDSEFKIALLKYNGGGDWYANPTSLPNLISFCNSKLNTNIFSESDVVEASSPDIFNYPFVHLTGHGNVVFSDFEVENLRNYLLSGGFIHIDDNYGMDEYIRPQIERLFPNKELVEVGFSHPIYNCFYNFSNGLPKVHIHDDKAPQGFGIFHNGRLVLFYTYECDLGDGWEDADVHNDSKIIRERSLMMGANLLYYVLMM